MAANRLPPVTRQSAVRSRERDARVAALWLVNGDAWVKLLRGAGKPDHAAHFEAALREVTEIVARHLGRRTMTAALDWASEQVWREPVEAELPRGRAQLH